MLEPTLELFFLAPNRVKPGAGAIFWGNGSVKKKIGLTTLILTN